MQSSRQATHTSGLTQIALQLLFCVSFVCGALWLCAEGNGNRGTSWFKRTPSPPNMSCLKSGVHQAPCIRYHLPAWTHVMPQSATPPFAAPLHPCRLPLLSWPTRLATSWLQKVTICGVGQGRTVMSAGCGAALYNPATASSTAVLLVFIRYCIRAAL